MRTYSPSRLNASSRILDNLAPRTLSGAGKYLFYAFSIYLVLPIVDIPLLGLSLSAPMLFLVFLEIILRPRSPLGRYKTWFGISYLFLFGLLFSLVGNALFRDSEIQPQHFLTLLRYGFWIIAFGTTLVVISSGPMLSHIGPMIGVAILVLCGLRLVEAVFFGRWGAWTSPQLLAQNTYGIQFSMFFPFALTLLFVIRGWKRYVLMMILFLSIAAIAGNGSRSSWISVATGSTLFFVLYAVSQRWKAVTLPFWLSVAIGLLLLIVAIVPQDILDPIINRYDSFDTLGSDKSYMIRELMVQKGIRLFTDSPLFGVGIGNFREVTIPLDIPHVLSYATQSHFDAKSAHNSYIALLGETGLMGIIPFMLLHTLCFFRGLPAAINMSRSGNLWGIAIFCSYVGMSIHLWAFSGITSTAPWFIYGLLVGVIESGRSRDPHRQSPN